MQQVASSMVSYHVRGQRNNYYTEVYEAIAGLKEDGKREAPYLFVWLHGMDSVSLGRGFAAPSLVISAFCLKIPCRCFNNFRHSADFGHLASVLPSCPCHVSSCDLMQDNGMIEPAYLRTMQTRMNRRVIFMVPLHQTVSSLA